MKKGFQSKPYLLGNGCSILYSPLTSIGLYCLKPQKLACLPSCQCYAISFFLGGAWTIPNWYRCQGDISIANKFRNIETVDLIQMDTPIYGVSISARPGLRLVDPTPRRARRLQFISTKRKEKGVGANIDNLHKAGLGQEFGIDSIADCGLPWRDLIN
jgi:hypothetical protein